MKIMQALRLSIAFYLLLSLFGFAYGSCDKNNQTHAELIHDKIVDILSIRIFALVSNLANERGDVSMYEDIIKDATNKIAQDEKMIEHFVNSLSKEFSCGEIAAIYEFMNSDTGKRFNNFLYGTYSADFFSSPELKQTYTDHLAEIRNAVLNRRQLILNFLENNHNLPEYKYVDVVVASDQLEKGTLLGKDVLAIRSVPKKYANTHFIRPNEVEAIFGKKTNRVLESGEALILDFVD